MRDGQAFEVEYIERIGSIVVLAAGLAHHLDTGDEDAPELELSWPIDHPAGALNSLDEVVPRSIMTDGHDVSLQLQGAEAQGRIVGISDDRRQAPLRQAEARHTIPGELHESSRDWAARLYTNAQPKARRPFKRSSVTTSTMSRSDGLRRKGTNIAWDAPGGHHLVVRQGERPLARTIMQAASARVMPSSGRKRRSARLAASSHSTVSPAACAAPTHFAYHLSRAT